MGSGFQKQKHTEPQRTTAKSEGREKNPKADKRTQWSEVFPSAFHSTMQGKEVYTQTYLGSAG